MVDEQAEAAPARSPRARARRQPEESAEDQPAAVDEAAVVDEPTETTAARGTRSRARRQPAEDAEPTMIDEPAAVVAEPTVIERPAETAAVAAKPRPRKQEKVGRVVSDKNDKTVVVAVDYLKRHRLYKKMLRRTSKFHAHDENNECQMGDLVRIVETRPLSKLKRWRVAEILQRAVRV